MTRRPVTRLRHSKVPKNSSIKRKNPHESSPLVRMVENAKEANHELFAKKIRVNYTLLSTDSTYATTRDFMHGRGKQFSLLGS
jgi:hypothetical protein